MSFNDEKIFNSLEAFEKELLNADFDYEAEVKKAIDNCQSLMDTEDYVLSITIGILASIFDTNDAIKDFLDKVHQCANSGGTTGSKFGDLLAKILGHSGDSMDIPEGSDGYVARNSSFGGSGPHRVFWGHDILSFGTDNPLYVSIKQYGVVRGVLQAVRHLIADTCSKQGLPIPGSSWFDYNVLDKKDGKVKVHNRLIDFCQKYSQETLGKKQSTFNNDVFNSMFSIHMEDIISSGLIAVSLEAYWKIRKENNDMKRAQMRVLSYSFCFFGSAIIGAVKTGGIPQINWPCFTAMAKNTLKMVNTSRKEVNSLMVKTKLICGSSLELLSYESLVKKEFITEIKNDLSSKTNKQRNELIEKLGG